MNNVQNFVPRPAYPNNPAGPQPVQTLPQANAWPSPAAPAYPQQQPAFSPFANIFSGIKNAKALVKAEYIRPGHYWMRINACKIGQTRKGITFAAVEMTITRVLDNQNGVGHSLGEDVTFYVDRSSDYFLPEIKTFVANVMGLRKDDVEERHAMMVFGPDQPLTGTTVEVQARFTTTQKGGTFTNRNFKREVPASEILQALTPQEQERFYPGNILQQMAHVEAQHGQVA